MPEYLKREEMPQNAEAVFCSGLKPVNYLPNITPETNDAIKQNISLQPANSSISFCNYAKDDWRYYYAGSVGIIP